MEINEERQDGIVVVAPVGRIDSTTAEALDRHLIRLPNADDRRVVVDFGKVDYISSAGLRVMLTLAKRIREARGALAICSLEDSVWQVFELAGFLPLFSVAKSRDDAIRTVAAG
jgi:stage II sporulation protein AA (anti-sigma F factor antagonist)